MIQAMLEFNQPSLTEERQGIMEATDHSTKALLFPQAACCRAMADTVLLIILASGAESHFACIAENLRIGAMNGLRVYQTPSPVE